jgi:hypothetical protein
MLAAVGVPDVLINNAGVSTGGPTPGSPRGNAIALGTAALYTPCTERRSTETLQERIEMCT